ncbi:hypothetical protein SUDANB6_00126 [Streptomyces sp. enrichment culture]
MHDHEGEILRAPAPDRPSAPSPWHGSPPRTPVPAGPSGTDRADRAVRRSFPGQDRAHSRSAAHPHRMSAAQVLRGTTSVARARAGETELSRGARSDSVGAVPGPGPDETGLSSAPSAPDHRARGPAVAPRSVAGRGCSGADRGDETTSSCPPHLGAARCLLRCTRLLRRSSPWAPRSPCPPASCRTSPGPVRSFRWLRTREGRFPGHRRWPRTGRPAGERGTSPSPLTARPPAGRKPPGRPEAGPAGVLEGQGGGGAPVPSPRCASGDPAPPAVPSAAGR